MDRMSEFNIGNSPLPEVQAGAARYTQQAGIARPEYNYGSVAMPHQLSRSIGQAYMQMPEFDRSAVPAYRQMALETARQFEHLTKPRSKGGMGIDVTVHDQDVYGADDVHKVYPEMAADVSQNRHMGVLSTKSTGGHPVFSNDENDMFRAVHDVFGHLGSGRGIDMHGEEAATQKHAAMFTPLARQAMMTETRGQNAALHLTGDFQDQKVGIMSARHRTLSPHQFGEGLAREASHENRLQGIDPGDY